MHQLPIIPLVSLAVASILLGLAYADAVLYSPAALMACLTFTFATVLAYWIYCQPCSNKEAKDLTTGVGQGTSEKDETNEQNKPSFLSKLRFWEHPTSSGEKMEKHSGMEGQVIGVSKAKLRQWYTDGDLQWRVQERRWTKLKLQVPHSGPVQGPKQLPRQDHKPEEMVLNDGQLPKQDHKPEEMVLNNGQLPKQDHKPEEMVLNDGQPVHWTCKVFGWRDPTGMPSYSEAAAYCIRY